MHTGLEKRAGLTQEGGRPPSFANLWKAASVECLLEVAEGSGNAKAPAAQFAEL